MADDRQLVDEVAIQGFFAARWVNPVVISDRPLMTFRHRQAAARLNVLPCIGAYYWGLLLGLTSGAYSRGFINRNLVKKTARVNICLGATA
jgi:hypothetical protein